MQINFLVDADFGMGEDYNANLKAAVLAAKHNYHPLNRKDYYMDRIGTDIPHRAPCVFFGTMQAARKVRHLRPDIWPGVVLNDKAMTASHFSQLFPDEMLNRDCVYLPFAAIPRQAETLIKLYGSKVFIRPDSGGKAFAGTVVNLKDERWMRPSLFPEVPGDTMTLVAPEVGPGRRHGEHRFFVVDGVVAAQSRYKTGNAPSQNKDVPEHVRGAADDYARRIRGMGDPLGWGYVIDLAEARDESVKIVEFNSLSCSGQYSCDAGGIVGAVARYIKKQSEEEAMDAMDHTLMSGNVPN